MIGKPGALAESILNPDGNGERLHSKETRDIRQGDVLSFRLSGAGGYGPPEKRSRAAIENDIADGYVSAEAARRFIASRTSGLSAWYTGPAARPS